MKQTILLTGGCGFIGSHCCVELIQNGYDVIIVDNLTNSNKNIIINIEKITNINPKFYNNNISDENNMDIIFNDNKIDIVIHLAGFKSVKESKIDPLKYYENNVSNLIILLKCMKKHNVNKLIFSSSALVYGNSDIIPISEECNINILNPYAQTKFMSELILKDCSESYDISCIALRYFNPVGCHSSGLIEENYKNNPNNLFPIIVSIYNGYKDKLEIFGGDYNTKDGTGIRDYIHVEDIARGHIQTLKYLASNNFTKFDTFNLGTGIGYSVLEIINKFELHTNKKLPYIFKDRRMGDPDILLADCNKANKIIEFNPIYNLDDMVISSLKSYNLKNI
jgi:UDP-glucose 4-epimerase